MPFLSLESQSHQTGCLGFHLTPSAFLLSYFPWNSQYSLFLLSQVHQTYPDLVHDTQSTSKMHLGEHYHRVQDHKLVLPTLN